MTLVLAPAVRKVDFGRLRRPVLLAVMSPQSMFDYAAERARYLEVLGKIIAYKLSDGSDLGMVNFSGLEHQATQVDTRPPKRRRKKKAAAAPTAEDAKDATKTRESQ